MYADATRQPQGPTPVGQSARQRGARRTSHCKTCVRWVGRQPEAEEDKIFIPKRIALRGESFSRRAFQKTMANI